MFGWGRLLLETGRGVRRRHPPDDQYERSLRAGGEGDVLYWTGEAPSVAGYYWYRHPATHEHPAIVRVAAADGELRVFTGMSVHAPMRMLAGGHWAGPVAGPP